MIILDINRRVLIYFALLFDAVTFKKKSSFLELFVSGSLEWLKTASVLAVRQNIEGMKFKASQRKCAVKNLILRIVRTWRYGILELRKYARSLAYLWPFTPNQ